MFRALNVHYKRMLKSVSKKLLATKIGEQVGIFYFSSSSITRHIEFCMKSVVALTYLFEYTVKWGNFPKVFESFSSPLHLLKIQFYNEGGSRGVRKDERIKREDAKEVEKLHEKNSVSEE